MRLRRHKISRDISGWLIPAVKRATVRKTEWPWKKLRWVQLSTPTEGKNSGSLAGLGRWLELVFRWPRCYLSACKEVREHMLEYLKRSPFLCFLLFLSLSTLCLTLATLRDRNNVEQSPLVSVFTYLAEYIFSDGKVGTASVVFVAPLVIDQLETSVLGKKFVNSQCSCCSSHARRLSFIRYTNKEIQFRLEAKLNLAGHSYRTTFEYKYKAETSQVVKFGHRLLIRANRGIDTMFVSLIGG